MSHTLLILKNCTTFKDVQMMLQRFFDISTVFRFPKVLCGRVPSIPVAVLELRYFPCSCEGCMTHTRTHRLLQLALSDVSKAADSNWVKITKGARIKTKMRLSIKLFILFVIFVACFELSNAKRGGGGRGKTIFLL